MAQICVVIGRQRHKMVQLEVQEAAKQGARLIEIRVDFLGNAPDFKRLLENKPCPLMATIRRQADGGRWEGREEERQKLLRVAITSGFDYVDIETDIADQVRRFRDVKRVVSYHNLHEVPADLEAIYERMCKQDADVVKVAVTAQQPSDNLRVLALMKNAPKPTTAFCMGDFGLPSRFLGAWLGAAFTYGAFNKEYRLAPGIPSVDELRQIYDYESINADTQVFGVIGDPIGHSLSPVVHNAAFRNQGMNCIYLPFRVPRGQLSSFLKDFESIPVKGWSVTIPHKEAAAELAQTCDEAVKQTRSANTLVRGKSGYAAFSTDFQAGVDALCEPLPGEPAGRLLPDKQVVLLLGAGGVARALAHGLHNAGAQIVVASRTLERAKSLAEEVEGRAVEWHVRHSVPCNILINCTPIGMHPNVDECPVHAGFLKPSIAVMDTVYNPETTLLVKEARAHGCHVRTGVEMFIRQAALQFKLFTGQEAPEEVMRKAVRRALSPVSMPDDRPEAG